MHKLVGCNVSSATDLTSRILSEERTTCNHALLCASEDSIASNNDTKEATPYGETTVPDELETFEMGEVWRGLRDIQTWLTGIATLALIVTLYSYALFLPTIITGLGYSGQQAQLRTVPPYVPAVFLTGMRSGSPTLRWHLTLFSVIVAYWSDRLRLRIPFVLALLPLTIA
ncbi:hypothetical protein MPER_00652, partial [Moniliophthora perniciosa FA553]